MLAVLQDPTRNPAAVEITAAVLTTAAAAVTAAAVAAAGRGPTPWSLLHSLPRWLCSSSSQPGFATGPNTEPQHMHTSTARPMSQAHQQQQQQQ